MSIDDSKQFDMTAEENRLQVANKLRAVAEDISNGKKYVVLALAICDENSEGETMVIVDDGATPELADEMSEAIKNDIFELLDEDEEDE
jgi:hypothetical protein